MEELEAGKENSTEDVNIENVDNIICDEELQPEVINPDIDQSIEDSKEPSTLTSQPPQKITKIFKGKHSE